MSITKPAVATEESFDLAEGPFWDPIRQQLLWVDIRTGTVLVGTLNDDGTITPIDRVTFPGSVGAVAVSASGEWIVAGAERILMRSATGEVSEGPRVIPPGTGSRLNDGKPDPAGRFLVGTLRLEGESTHELLALVGHGGEVDVIDNDLTLSNGLAWSADGTTLFNVDTLSRTIFTRPYDPDTGVTGERSTFLQVAEGSPDGICMDVEGHLWLALWGLGLVQRYSPAGELARVFEIPAPHTSSVAFGGPDLDTLVITTATQDLTDEQRVAYPLSGRLFTFKPGVRGVAQSLWRGSVSASPDR
ncbi:MAG: SMP-30/gluconolactonase/LRE family protein [Pseudolysinimonas sp.]